MAGKTWRSDWLAWRPCAFWLAGTASSHGEALLRGKAGASTNFPVSCSTTAAPSGSPPPRSSDSLNRLGDRLFISHLKRKHKNSLQWPMPQIKLCKYELRCVFCDVVQASAFWRGRERERGKLKARKRRLLLWCVDCKWTMSSPVFQQQYSNHGCSLLKVPKATTVHVLILVWSLVVVVICWSYSESCFPPVYSWSAWKRSCDVLNRAG